VSKKAFETGLDGIVGFVDSKWDFRSNDRDREWEKEGDEITSVLKPSFVLQSPMVQPTDPKLAWGVPNGLRVAVGLVEVRVEVLWGKAYLGHLDATYFYRRDRVTEDYTGFLGGILHQPPPVGPNGAWVQDEGYMDCAFEIAEKLAQAAHIEYIRVDIFLERGNPKGCMINEISLTSGYPYYGHGEFIANMWRNSLKDKSYKVLKNDTPVYELKS